jgi:hypothetical protein
MVAHPRPNAEAAYPRRPRPRARSSPLRSFQKSTRGPSPRAAHFSTIPGRPSRTSGSPGLQPKALANSGMLGGEYSGERLSFPSRSKRHSPADLPMSFCSSPTAYTTAVTPQVPPQRSEAPEQRSGGGATSGLDLLQGALFHNALTSGSWHYRISWCKASARAIIARDATMSRSRVLKRFIWRSFMDCSSRSLLAALPPRFPVTSSGQRAQHSSVATSIGFGFQQVAGGEAENPLLPYMCGFFHRKVTLRSSSSKTDLLCLERQALNWQKDRPRHLHNSMSGGSECRTANASICWACWSC